MTAANGIRNQVRSTYGHQVVLAIREFLIGLAIIALAAAAVSGPLPPA